VDSRPAADVAEQFNRGGLWVAILVMSGWHVCATLPFVVTAWAAYGLARSGVLLWVAYAVAGAVIARAVLRGGWQRPALPWGVCCLLLAGVLANMLIVPGGFFGRYGFAFTEAGWFALVTLWRRGLGELLGFFAANAAVGLLTLDLLHETTRAQLAMFMMVACGSSVFQITIYVGTRAVAATAGRAAEAEDAAARARNARLAAEAVQAARRARYETIRATVVRLLEGLATGSLDLSAAEARQEIAMAVTRLRRYLVENDDVPDPLSHELRACADAAERRGVAVDLIAPAGTIPMVSIAARRMLTEPVIQVLAATASRARITVVASATEVAIAIVADARLTVPIAPASDSVHCDWDQEGDRLWAQARWTRPSASFS
jgi:signal transduction histidine kinase